MIFVVDDDPRIRSATAGALKGFGYVVREFADGVSALQAMAETAPDLLVTDVLMPGMKGTELAVRAKETHGVARILFISGDIGDTAHHEFGNHELLAKPFTAAALKAAIERAFT